MRVDRLKVNIPTSHPLHCRSFTVIVHARSLLHLPLLKPRPYLTFPDTNSNCSLQIPFIHEKPRVATFDKAKPASKRSGRTSPRNWSANAFRGPLSCLPYRHRFHSLPFVPFTQVAGLPPHSLVYSLSPFSTVSTALVGSQAPTTISNNLQTSHAMAKPLKGTTSSSSLSFISN